MENVAISAKNEQFHDHDVKQRESAIKINNLTTIKHGRMDFRIIHEAQLSIYHWIRTHIYNDY